MTIENPISLWDASAQEPEIKTPTLADVDVDLAIVGGGFTGLSTALHAAEKGLSAHVIEAEHIGYGGSGRNVGYVNAGVWLPPAKVREALGPAYGPGFVERFGAAPEYVFSLIERHQIRCEATKNGTIHAAHSAAGVEELRGRHAEWHRLGAPVELLDREAVRAMTGTDRYVGGLLDRRAGTINPMGYCRGLARAALGAGATIRTGHRATKLRRDGAAWVVETTGGRVRARAVVLGTNAYTDELWPDLNRSFTKLHYLQLATEPLGEAGKDILPGRQGLWDTAKVMFNFRRDVSDRLLIGSMGKIIGTADRGLTHRWAMKQIARTFPQLGSLRIEMAWHGQIAMTPDHLPRIYALAENLYTPIGYNGRGITTGTVFGKAIADLLAGADPSTLPLPMSDLATVPGAPLAARFYQAAFTAKQVYESI